MVYEIFQISAETLSYIASQVVQIASESSLLDILA